MEDALHGAFLPDLFKGFTYHISRIEVTGMPVKQAGIAFPDPNQTYGANWIASCVVTGRLVAELRGTAEFWSWDHAFLMREGRDEILRWHTESVETALGEARDATSREDARQMERITRTRAWLSVLPSIVNGT